MSHTKGKGISGELIYIGSTSIVLIEAKGSRRLSIATVLTEAVDIDTNCKYPVDFQANARRICQCVNCHDPLLDALELAKSVLGCHIAHHINNNTILCQKCKRNVKDAVERINAAIAAAEKSE